MELKLKVKGDISCKFRQELFGRTLWNVTKSSKIDETKTITTVADHYQQDIQVTGPFDIAVTFDKVSPKQATLKLSAFTDKGQFLGGYTIFEKTIDIPIHQTFADKTLLTITVNNVRGVTAKIVVVGDLS
jgi:hypothetical protein